MVYVVDEDANAWHALIKRDLTDGEVPSSRVRPPRAEESGTLVAFTKAHAPAKAALSAPPVSRICVCP